MEDKDFKELLKLKEENPDLPIRPLVNSEVVADDCGWWLAEWGKAEINRICGIDERLYIEDDFDELVEDWLVVNEGDPKYKNLTEKELKEKAKQVVENYGWEKCILVRITN